MRNNTKRVDSWDIISKVILVIVVLLTGKLLLDEMYVSQEDCCCKGVVTKPCVCWGFVDCVKEVCGEREGMVNMCCGRMINCSKLKEGCREIWTGDPKYDYNEIEYSTCDKEVDE